MGKPIFLLFGGNQLNFGVLNKFQNSEVQLIAASAGTARSMEV